MSLIPKIDHGYQFTIPEHDRGVCNPSCIFYWSKDEQWPICIACLAEVVQNQDLIPGPNCHPGTYVCRRRQ